MTVEEVTRAVAESVAGEIANLGSPESRRSYDPLPYSFTDRPI